VLLTHRFSQRACISTNAKYLLQIYKHTALVVMEDLAPRNTARMPSLADRRNAASCARTAPKQSPEVQNLTHPEAFM
jgi:hypothetical protein